MQCPHRVAVGPFAKWLDIPFYGDPYIHKHNGVVALDWRAGCGSWAFGHALLAGCAKSDSVLLDAHMYNAFDVVRRAKEKNAEVKDGATGFLRETNAGCR